MINSQWRQFYPVLELLMKRVRFYTLLLILVVVTLYSVAIYLWISRQWVWSIAAASVAFLLYRSISPYLFTMLKRRLINQTEQEEVREFLDKALQDSDQKRLINTIQTVLDDQQAKQAGKNLDRASTANEKQNEK